MSYWVGDIHKIDQSVINSVFDRSMSERDAKIYIRKIFNKKPSMIYGENINKLQEYIKNKMPEKIKKDDKVEVKEDIKVNDKQKSYVDYINKKGYNVSIKKKYIDESVVARVDGKDDRHKMIRINKDGKIYEVKEDK